jgi:hypothetical protein
MLNSCEDIKSRIENFSLIQSCDLIKNGMLRIQTPFQYMDGSKIDLFIGNTPDFNKIVVSDMGQTIATLLDVHMKPWTTKKRKEMVSEICNSLGVSQEGGEFKIVIDSDKIDEFPMSIVRLSQACIRISDMAMSQRYRTIGQFKEDLEEVIASSDLEYESNISVEGRFGKPIEIDFKVQGSKVITLVQTLSTANTAASHNLSNEVFRRWYDLENLRPQYQFLTIYDSNNDVFRADDLARIEGVSSTFGFPAQPEQIIASLVA